MATCISSASGTRLLQGTQHSKGGLCDTHQASYPSPEMETSHTQAHDHGQEKESPTLELQQGPNIPGFG